MNILIPRVSRRLASTLVVTLVICSILSFSIFGYLSLVEQQAKLSLRSQAWNVAIAVSEAGIEEGLQHLNSNRTNLNSNGWTKNGNYYTRSNTLSDGNSYFVRIDYSSPNYPQITSQSYVRSVSVANNKGPLFFAATGVGAPVEISRTVLVKCRRGSLFLYALAAKKLIDLKGNNVYSDSFDSGSPLYSNNGLYDPNPLKVRDMGDMASDASIVNTINVGNANIYGHVSTGPGGTIAIGGGSVGEHSWQATHTGIESGWVTDDANFTFPSTDLPYTSGPTPPSGNIVEDYQVITTNSTTQSTPPSYMPMGGIQSNVISTTLVQKLPSPIPPGTTTNTTVVTTTTPPPSTVNNATTNTVGYQTVMDYSLVKNFPVTTNNTGKIILSSTYPNPAPSDLTTNLTYVKDKPFPYPGTYVGGITTNGVNYSYMEITSYQWPEHSYTYPLYTYTYTVYSYNIPTYTYTYGLYTTNTYWTTNFYDYVLDTGNWYLPTYKGKMYVKGVANLVIGNGISMGGSELIKVPKGGSLTVWGGGNSATISGSSVINKAGIAANCVFYCAPTVTKLAFSGNGEFTGAIAAPEADTTMNGGGSGVFDIIGSVMVKSVVLNGSFRFHYDEALGLKDNGSRFLIRSWDEVTVIP